MTVHTFGTTVDMSHFVEIPDPADPTQPKRPEVGRVLTLRNALTESIVGTVSTQALGYWGTTLTDVPAVDVSADEGASWVGPLWSAEAQEAGWTAGPYAESAAASADLAASAASAAKTAAVEARDAALAALAEAESIAGGQDAPTEQAIATVLANSDSEARQALDAAYDTKYDRKRRTDAADYATLQAALDATPPGSVCFLPPGTYSPSAPLTWPHDVTIQGEGKVTINVTGNATGLVLQPGHRKPRIRGVRFVGTLSPNTAAPASINAQIAIGGMDSTLADPIVGLNVVGCEFVNFGYAPIRAKHVHKFHVSKCEFDQYGYTGLGLSSAKSGTITKNRFYGTGVLTAYSVNSYAAFLNFFEPDGLTASPESQDVVFEGNFVYNQAWEGLDAHSGHRISFVGNTFVDCQGAAIALVSSGSQWETACQDITVANNIIYGRADRTSTTGIIFRGGQTPSGTWRVRGTITGNTMWRVGNLDAAVGRRCGINVAEGRGVVVSNNTIHEPQYAGILVQDVPGALIANNVVVDPWLGGSSSMMVEINSLSQPGSTAKLTLSGNTLVRGAMIAGQDGIPANAFIGNVGFVAPDGATIYQEGNTYPPGTGFGGAIVHQRSIIRNLVETLGTAAPTTGTWVRGDRVLHLQPTSGGNVGWICVTAGTPGTWKTYGTIS